MKIARKTWIRVHPPMLFLAVSLTETTIVQELTALAMPGNCEFSDGVV